MVISTMSIRSSLCVLNYFWTEDVGWKQEIRNWGMNNERHVCCSCCCPQKQTGIANWTNQLHLVWLSLHWLNPVDGLSTIRKGTEGNNQVARLVVNYKEIKLSDMFQSEGGLFHWIFILSSGNTCLALSSYFPLKLLKKLHKESF